MTQDDQENEAKLAALRQMIAEGIASMDMARDGKEAFEEVEEYIGKLTALRAAVQQGIDCDPAEDIDGEEFFEQMREHIAARSRPITKRDDDLW